MNKGKFVYKDQQSMDKMLRLYDKQMALLNVDYSDKYIETSFGKTHVVIAGDVTKPHWSCRPE